MWKYTLGTVVQERDGSAHGLYIGKDAMPMFGHVIGFDHVEYENDRETILRVQWDDGSVRSIHPSRVKVNGEA